LTKIAVVIPTLNEEQYITRAIESILSSPLKPSIEREVIVVDSSSTDRTVEIVKDRFSFSGRRVILVENAPRFKLYARDFAMKEIVSPDTDIVVASDADTYWPPQSLYKLIEPILTNTSVVATSSPRVYESPLPLRMVSGIRLYWTTDLMFGSNSSYLREAYFQSGGFRLSGINHLNNVQVQIEEENNFLKRLLRVGEFRYVKEAPVFVSPRRFLDRHFMEQVGKTRFEEYYGDS
jgi:glycosyltransferase involved in cell wall biosynthesis